MKQLSALLVFVLLGLITLAQAPQKMNYQAAARDADGNVLRSVTIKVRISIRTDNSTGAIEYSETRSVTTNQFGTFNIAIGGPGAIYSTGTLSDVKWDEGDKYMQVEIDPANGNNFINLGVSQLLSVPYALYALSSGDSTNKEIDAHNGVSVSATEKIQIGNDLGSTEAELINDREIPLNRYSLRFKSKENYSAFKDGKMYFQQDPSGVGGEVVIINPIQQDPTHVPFMMTRGSFPQNGGVTTNNETANWGFNIGYGGGAFKPGLPGIGYSIESNFYPDAGSRRWVESHEFYLRPDGQQVRLKSYTIKTGTANDDEIDFYHTSDNMYVKTPGVDNYAYWTVVNSRTAGNTEMHLTSKENNLQITLARATPALIQFSGKLPESELMLSSFRSTNLPSLSSYNGNGEAYNLFKGSLLLDKDNTYQIGDYTSRIKMLYSRSVNSDRGFFGRVEAWGRNEGSATLHVQGETTDGLVPGFLVQNGNYKDIFTIRNTGESTFTNPGLTRRVSFNPTATQNSGKVFEINTTETGILIPRLTTAQRNAIASPANGELIFNTDAVIPGESGAIGNFEYYQSSNNSWRRLADPQIAAAALENFATKDLVMQGDRVHNGNSKSLTFSGFEGVGFSANFISATSAKGFNFQSQGSLAIMGKTTVNIGTTNGQTAIVSQSGTTLNDAGGVYRFMNLAKATPQQAASSSLVVDANGVISKTAGFFKNVNNASNTGDYTIGENDYTVTLSVISSDRTVVLPNPQSCAGRIIVLWNYNSQPFKWSTNYPISLPNNTTVSAITNSQSWQLQSNGYAWLKIN